jgi:glycosyltransferase involved in cell wall biosynthesis
MLLTDALFGPSMRKACAVAVSSRATGDDLAGRHGVAWDKIHVVPPAPASFFRPCPDDASAQRVRERLQAPDGYVLHFSSVNDPRDNTRVVLQAFHDSLPNQYPKRRLAIGGRCDLRAQGLSGLVDALGLEPYLILPGFVPEQMLVELYWGADVYVDPSLYGVWFSGRRGAGLRHTRDLLECGLVAGGRRRRRHPAGTGGCAGVGPGAHGGFAGSDARGVHAQARMG